MLTRLSCLCGFHRPELPGEWNLGYCFSRCKHCDASMVRSVLGGWKVPKSFRVVAHAGPRAYDDLDNFLQSRERPREPVSKSPPGLAPSNAPSFSADSRRRPAGSTRGSPFDFSDFEPAGESTQPPLKNVKRA